MGVTLWSCRSIGKRCRFAACGLAWRLRHRGAKWQAEERHPMRTLTQPRGPLARRRTDCLPVNHPLPAVYRLGDDHSEPAGKGEWARDMQLSRVEAALLAADEPLTTRHLIAAAGLPDAASARRLVRKLQALYDQDGTAFQVEELAGGFQLLTRAIYHRWLVRLR